MVKDGVIKYYKNNVFEYDRKKYFPKPSLMDEAVFALKSPPISEILSSSIGDLSWAQSSLEDSADSGGKKYGTIGVTEIENKIKLHLQLPSQ